MTTKTPERIATDTEEVVEQITKRLFEQVSHGVVNGRGNTDRAQITWWGLFDQIEAAVRAGIEADRTQRPTLSEEPEPTNEEQADYDHYLDEQFWGDRD